MGPSLVVIGAPHLQEASQMAFTRAGSPSQDTRAVGSQSIAHKANLLSGSGKVFSALGAGGWRSTYRAPEYKYCRGHERGTDKDAQRRSPRATAATSKLPSDSTSHSKTAGYRVRPCRCLLCDGLTSINARIASSRLCTSSRKASTVGDEGTPRCQVNRNSTGAEAGCNG